MKQSSSANSNASTQAKILEALSRRHHEHETGERAAPAFSSATIQDFTSDDESTWQDIASEIGDAGIDGLDTRSVSGHKFFIRYAKVIRSSSLSSENLYTTVLDRLRVLKSSDL